MGINKIKVCIDCARNNYIVASKIYKETIVYNLAVVSLYYSLYMYLHCMCECYINIKQPIGLPSGHPQEIEIVKKNLKTSSDYMTIFNAAYNFRYRPHMINAIQDKSKEHDVKVYFDSFQKCKNEICAQIKKCGFG